MTVCKQLASKLKFFLSFNNVLLLPRDGGVYICRIFVIVIFHSVVHFQSVITSFAICIVRVFVVAANYEFVLFFVQCNCRLHK